ncbi:hypothetical protein HGH93_12260 [Chitinophaga polysaccharea]|uniref:hypothetical protein n=1 Tax=Chitinophaga polysaccharea TaxID=1293035 RepID=UPI001455A0A5|nr:hypothetical protein [Chitinophaga polysaccharea]NLR58880.1 hypothetical protein [Chitinophaga polysaccharea]
MQEQPDEELFTQLVTKVVNEKNNILERIGRHLYELRKEKQVEWFIQHSQQHLVNLMNQLAAYLPANSLLQVHVPRLEYTWPNLYQVIYYTLGELLSYFEQKFERYLDIDCNVPASYQLKARQKFRQDIALLSEGLIASGVDEQLQSIIGMPFLELSEGNHTDSRLTYRQLHYLTEMNKRLFQLLDVNGGNDNFAEKLHELLLFINFNSIHYFEYWRNMITAELTNHHTIREKLERLMYLQKEISQAVLKPVLAFNTMRPLLQNKMQAWLAEEITYYKEVSTAIGGTQLPDELIRWKGFKIQTIFSVPQLGHILKLLLDSGLYLNKNRSEVLEFFSYFFTSVKQDSVSPGSLRTNFYKDNAAVSRSVQDILMQLANLSHKGPGMVAFLVMEYFLQ